MLAVPPDNAVSRYGRHEQIGEGGLGQVYRAWDNQLQRWVALKRLRSGEAAHSDTQTVTAWREAMTLASLQHPNIVTIYDFGQDENGPFVVMELLKGETLETAVERKPFSEADFFVLARQSLEGLVAAHHVGLIHRDLKPGNLMLTALPSGSFQVKILDFGLAKFVSEPTLQTTDAAGTIMGSIYTMAPEQFKREPVDTRIDLYALGCIFYYTLTGRFPFLGLTMVEVMMSHVNHQFLPLAPQRPDVSPALCLWVTRLIAAQPEQRPTSAQIALEELLEISATTRVATKTAPVAAVKKSVARVSRGTTSAIILLAVISAGFTGWFWWQQPYLGPKEVLPKAPIITPIPAEAAIRNPTDVTALRPLLGQEITVEGKITGTTIDPVVLRRFLNFSTTTHDKAALRLCFRLPEAEAIFPADKWSGYLQQKVRAHGKLEERDGSFVMEIKEAAQLQIIP